MRTIRYLMSIRHSLMQSATQNFVPRRYFFVRYRVGTSGTEIYRIFVPWSKSFGSGKLLYRLCTSGNDIYRIFVPWPKVPATPVEPSCGTELCGTSTVVSGCMRRPTRSWTRRKDAVALREVRLRDFIVWFLCRLGLPLQVAMDIADRAVPDGTAGAPIVL